MSYEKKLEAMGYVIEPAELHFGKMVEAVNTGSLVFTSGQLPIWGERSIKGKVGTELTVEQAYEAARWSTLNALRAIKAVVGSLDEIVRFVKVLGMVNVGGDFDNTSAVINGCSDLLCEVFGQAGEHARSAVGVTLPFNYAVEIEIIAEVKVR